jgi:hypothetical protein
MRRSAGAPVGGCVTVYAHRLLPSKLALYASYAQQAFPLDMSQYHNLFNTARMPHADKDAIQRFTPSPRHFIAMRHGQFFAVDLFDANGAYICMSLVI